jgi:predicted RNA-binding Zn ribbon-like protein
MTDTQTPPTPAGPKLIEDFVNTIELDVEGPEREALADPAALRTWLAEPDLLPEGATVGDEDVERAHRVREALRHLLLANNGEPLDAHAITTLNEAADQSHLRVMFSADGHADLVPDSAGVPGALSRMLAASYTAMHDDTWHRLKACKFDTCQWAFYDHSKNRSRAWCSMQVCGNRAKARAYRERQRG